MSPVAACAGASAMLAVAVLAGRVRVSLHAARSPAGGRSPIAARWRLLPRLSRQAVTARPDDVADWCEGVARSLRSGSSLTAAVVEAADGDGPMARVVAPIARHVRRGTALAGALDRAAGPDGTQNYTFDPASPAGLALTVLRSCARFGGPAAAPLERAAMTLRSREAVLAEQHVHSAQARLSARVLTLVPVALLVLLAIADEKVRAAAMTPAGVAAVSLGALLNAAGAAWMRHIIGRPR